MIVISQLKTEFTDLYNDFNKKGGKAANREGTGFNEGTTASRGDWQDDYARIERRLDDLKIPSSRVNSRESPGGATAGTTGEAGETRPADTDAKLNDLAKFRARLEAFYAAAGGERRK